MVGLVSFACVIMTSACGGGQVRLVSATCDIVSAKCMGGLFGVSHMWDGSSGCVGGLIGVSHMCGDSSHVYYCCKSVLADLHHGRIQTCWVP